MRRFQVLVEGAFVGIGDAREVYGFFATFFVSSASASGAIVRISAMLSREMSDANIHARNNGWLKSCFLVRNILELDQDDEEKEGARGFTFFTIGALSCVVLAIRFAWARIFESWRIITV